MPEPTLLAGAIAALAIGGGLGWAIAHLRAGRRIAELETTLALERQAAGARVGEIERHISTLSQQALKENNQAFLQLAQESLKGFHTAAQGELALREKAVENLVKPIKDALEKTEKQIQEVEKNRHEAYGALRAHLESMAQAQQQLRGETQNLVQALRRPEVRGQWGELTLKRLVELAGMVEYCDFYTQEHTGAEGGNVRPDMIVRMPDGREIVVDVKTPLDAYLNAHGCSDETQRLQHLAHHARKVRERVRELAGKNYWSQFKNSPDFVVMFIPGEQFLSVALDHDRDLLEDALRQKIILATPMSFVALLRAVAYGWRQQALAANAEKIRAVGEDLYQRLAVFSEHLAKVGRHLDQSVACFNQAAGSFDSKLMPGARKFVELGINAKKEVTPAEQIEKAARQLESALGDSVRVESAMVESARPGAKSKP